MEQPLVSIVIPCYNAATYLEACLQSLYAQTYPHLEIILIDDGSSDGTLEIIKQQGDRVLYRTGPNQGANAARNTGMDMARGKYLKFFDADDIMLRDAIAMQVDGMEKLQPHQFIYGDVVDLDSKKPVFDNIFTSSEVTRDEMIYQLFEGNILTGCPLHQRQFIVDHGLRFEECLLSAQEWDFHLQIALAGGIFVHQDTLIYYYRDHDEPDRINQVMKQREVKLREFCLRYEVACPKIIAGYANQVMYPPIKTIIRNRLAKIEAKLVRAKQQDEALNVREIRKDLDPLWRVLLMDLRYICRRHFK
ncbi:glycosyltransferase [Verrucomicrobiaceae bacterium 5K15]|uniref:Glycosyltransferase n=1 Tax=Oceaniferula flava TaxID=2800421 RepID=A0AAE2S925_9BACT|nr:glycosyltransferase [Oceaniferula flavus]MBK1853848.1 glycosyltransferase [Oceaniferula flavus]MBM1135154.1 glycosyltransferase [Oceaniferula flavus]